MSARIIKMGMTPEAGAPVEWTPPAPVQRPLCWRIEIEGQPFSKARPRVTKYGTYTPAKQRLNAEKLAAHFRLAMPEPLEYSVGVELTFWRKGKQRIDLDNLVKQVLDAANGVCFVDDVQVVKLGATLELDNENPRTLVEIYEYATSMPRGNARDLTAVCVTCGDSFFWRPYASRPVPPKFCGIECQRKQPKPCEECAEPFLAYTPAQTFCCVACRSKNQRVKAQTARTKRNNALPPNLCRYCDARLVRRTAVLCRPCWLAMPNAKKRVARAEILAAEAKEKDAS